MARPRRGVGDGGDRTRIGFGVPRSARQGGGGLHVHYALKIEEADFDPSVERLRSRGYHPEVIGFDAMGRAFYVIDPDGNVVEFWTWDVGEHLRRGFGAAGAV